MIGIFTDYGLKGPYLGSIYSVFAKGAPQHSVFTLMADAPRCNPKVSAYLLSVLTAELPPGTIILAVVDPGVGSQDHKPVVLNLDGSWFIGPDNGLFDVLVKRSSDIKSWELPPPAQEISQTFHGRDLYAPACVFIANNDRPEGREFIWEDRHHWPDDLYECIYIDHFGNVMTGIRAETIDKASNLMIAGQSIQYADYFSAVEPGQALWYENSYGLLEIAVNKGSASEVLNLNIGTMVSI